MDLGVGLPNTVAGTDGRSIREWARQTDTGPFASLSVFDRVVYDSLDPLATLAAVATITERVRLATTVLIGPIRNTTLLAKEAATIDVLSGGRLTLGVALGARRDDYAAAETPYVERGSRLTRQLYDLRQNWESPEAGPRPTQDGGPELLVGGLSDAAYGRAGPVLRRLYSWRGTAARLRAISRPGTSSLGRVRATGTAGALGHGILRAWRR